jgi:hypothetical protein
MPWSVRVLLEPETNAGRLSPERALIAAIIYTVVEDCSGIARGGWADAQFNSLSDGVRGYMWVVDRDPWLWRYLDLLDIDPERFRSEFIRKFSKRWEPVIAKRAQEAEAARRALEGARTEAERAAANAHLERKQRAEEAMRKKLEYNRERKAQKREEKRQAHAKLVQERLDARLSRQRGASSLGQSLRALGDDDGS